ncbi:MAG TPA: hypothetical protein VLE97_04290 [Gaiellaceae bacterium]|nr:hypothetical protein [Gaiellaceae bacterium]
MTATAERVCLHQPSKALLHPCAREPGHGGKHVYPTKLGDGRTLFTIDDGGLQCLGRAEPEGHAPAAGEPTYREDG